MYEWNAISISELAAVIPNESLEELTELLLKALGRVRLYLKCMISGFHDKCKLIYTIHPFADFKIVYIHRDLPLS